jgi:GMP synthase-like glutamine amidotransferase
MILLVDLCYEIDSLSQYEFVHPVARALRRAGAAWRIMHYTEVEERELEGYSHAVLCGTALQDNGYMDRLDRFDWIKSFRGPMLGICAGMQVIGSVFGGELVPFASLGLQEIEILRETPLLGKTGRMEVYHLHGFGVTLPEEFLHLAGSSRRPEAFKLVGGPVYGIIFHPEVRSRWILERFASLQQEDNISGSAASRDWTRYR